MLQVHQIALVAPGKALALQGLFHLLEGGGGGMYARPGMEHQLAAQTFNVVDAVNFQPDGAALHRHGKTCVILFLHVLQRPAQALGKGKIIQWLENIVQRVHRIALNGILGQVRDEHDDHLRVLLPDIARCRHAVHKGHFHVHQNQVEFRPIALHQVLAVVVVGDLERPARLPAVVADELLQLSKALWVVLGDGDADHRRSLPFV